MLISVKNNLERGSALISSLFIMTLVAIAATAMSVRLQLDIYRTSLTIQSDKLYLASQIVSLWAIEELSRPDKEFYKNNFAGFLRELPKSLQNLSPGLITTGRLYDLQGRFNLNNLLNPNDYNMFLKLLEKTTSNINSEELKNIAKATRHWITPYIPGRGKDEFISYYGQQNPPFYPSQQLFQNISEFRLIRGVTDKVYQSLADVICVLPEATPINLNSASKKVLMSLGHGLSAAEVNEIIVARGKQGLINNDNLGLLLQKLQLPAAGVTVQSQYFMSISEVSGKDNKYRNYTIFKRQMDKNGMLSVSILSESVNVL